jgi:hypothetical protein
MKTLTITVPNHCPSCGQDNFIIYIGDGSFTIFKCRDCKAGYERKEIQDYISEGVPSF